VTLVEFLPPELAPAYLEAFGRAGLPTLDAKLRELEAGLACHTRPEWVGAAPMREPTARRGGQAEAIRREE